ncbi:MAG: hypothetical protein NTX45_25580, partial [Proteobacteria bacterium]|nr:hypothetical protein [Pseudomonadota bacterium]
LQRPMDDQTHLRIHIESEAILGVLAWCEAGDAELLNSVALKYEVDHRAVGRNSGLPRIAPNG